MKAVRFYGSGDIRCEEIPKPACQGKDVLVRVLYAGICGSDLHRYRKGMFTEYVPETMGHEFIGRIETVGEEVFSFQPGELVTANPMVPCGHCLSCQEGDFQTCSHLGYIGEVAPGCFAEWLTLPEAALLHVPETDDLPSLALAEPLAVALNICEQGELRAADSLHIIGCGAIGLLTILVAKAVYGVSRITVTERSPTRCRQAVRLGAQVESAQDECRCDKVIEAAGNTGAFTAALRRTKPNGTLLVVSVFEQDVVFDMNELVGAQLHLIGCNAYKRKHLRQAIHLLAEKRLDVRPLISKIFPLEACREAFSLLSAPETAAIKVLFCGSGEKDI